MISKVEKKGNSLYSMYFVFLRSKTVVYIKGSYEVVTETTHKFQTRPTRSVNVLVPTLSLGSGLGTSVEAKDTPMGPHPESRGSVSSTGRRRRQSSFTVDLPDFG